MLDENSSLYGEEQGQASITEQVLLFKRFGGKVTICKINIMLPEDSSC